MNLFKLASLLFFIIPLSASADVVITMGGDVNFNRNRLPANPQGVYYGDKLTPYDYFTTNLRPLINGDLNFANIETVVTEVNDLNDEEKKFAFASHTNSIRHLLDIGFNFFSLTNNHTYDYGIPGMERTAAEFAKLKTQHRMVYHGAAERKTLLRPKLFEINGIRIAFATITIADEKFRATDTKKGVLYIFSESDYKELIHGFATTKADFKILSTHYGTENQTTLDVGQRKRYEYAMEKGDINLIIGHHPHVIRPIQKTADKLIYYSLGNYLMLGSRDMTANKDINTDWGMFSRLYLERDPVSGKVKVDAVEVVPLTNTHIRTTPMKADKAALRINSLNSLGAQQLGDAALNLSLDSVTGHGVFCDNQMNSVRAKAMCAGSF